MSALRARDVVALLAGALLATPAAAGAFGDGVEEGDADLGETLATQGAPDELVYLDADGDGRLDEGEPVDLAPGTDGLERAVTVAGDGGTEPGTPAETDASDGEVVELDETLGAVTDDGTFRAGDAVVADHRGDPHEVDERDVILAGPEAGTLAGPEGRLLGASHDPYDGAFGYVDADADGDGSFSPSDDRPYLDTDRDGEVSEHDVRLFAAEPPDEPVDRDGDGVPDEEDNCPNTPNPDQEDRDGDGRGDPCDGDVDGDGIWDAADACPEQPGVEEEDGCPSEDTPDTDGDGVPDPEDACPHDVGPPDGDGCPPEERSEGPDADAEREETPASGLASAILAGLLAARIRGGRR